MRRLPVLVILPTLLLAQAVSGAPLRGVCQARLEEHLRRPNAGYFFYAEDADSTKHACGWSVEDPGEFDRYPSSAQAAFTTCQNLADERGVKSRCEPRARGGTLVGLSDRADPDTAGLVRDGMRCGQLPMNRWAWTERAFCDLPWHGPAAAAGVVIWNHGLSGTVAQYAAPVPPVLRLLHARGWDVVKINRNNLAETGVEQSLYRWTQRTLEEVASHRKEGYARVVLAGQSFGGYITLETADSTPNIFGVLAMSPGVRLGGGAGRLDPSITERIVGRLPVDRLVLVFPRGDSLFGSIDRGPGVAKVLAGRNGSYLLLDETLDIVDHGGGTTAKFAVKYGPCVVEYLAGAASGKGPVACHATAAQQARAARDLLPRPPKEAGRISWGILEPSGEVVSFALMDVAGVGRRVLFGVASGWRRGGLYDFSVVDSAATFTLPERGVVAVKAGTLTFSPVASGRRQTAALVELPDDQ